MRNTFLVAIALLFTLAANAQKARDGYDLVETWRCFDPTDYDKSRVLVILTRERLSGGDFEAGVVTVAGTEQVSFFEVTGFNRRWDFVEGEYAFIIHPDGDGFYYDLTMIKDGETTSASQSFNCVMR